MWLGNIPASSSRTLAFVASKLQFALLLDFSAEQVSGLVVAGAGVLVSVEERRFLGRLGKG